MLTNLTGIILCGGSSKRMGTNKALQKLGCLTFIEHISNVLKEMCLSIIISTNTNELDFLSFKKVKDKHHNIGPIAGIYSALSDSETEENLIVNCDTPFITQDFLKYLVANSSGYDLVLPFYKGHIQSLTGSYNKSILPKIEKEIENQHFKPIQMFKSFNLNILTIDDSLFFYKDSLLFNVNTQEDYIEACRIYQNISS
jgi:molybdopterin-guanine dinucleotide biosynthesis protein A